MKSCPAILRAAVMIVACAGLGAPLAQAQEEGLRRQAPAEGAARRLDTYGTGSTTDYVLQAFAFEPAFGDGASFAGNNFGSRYCTSSCSFAAPVMLPAGAVIVGMELEACDTDSVGQVNMNLIRISQLEGAFTNLGTLGTGTTSTPGCAFFSNLPFTPHTVNNETGSYQLRGDIFGSGAGLRFQAVRLLYRLQVSAGPATATFPNDVPTSHPFFRFVEALSAAGISGGCSAGSFCPNDPVTRGQMAVFLSTALGLHFPN
jgi:hypothetical protein